MKILEKIIEWGLCLFIFLLPWQTRIILREGNLNGYWEYGTVGIYATEILLWAIFLLTAVWWTVKKIKNKNEKSKNKIENSKLEINSKYKIPDKKYVFWFLMFFVLWSLISVLWSDSKILALYVWHWLAEGLSLFILLQIFRFDKKKLVWSFILSAFVQAGLGLWQFFSQATFASKWLGMAAHDPVEPGTYVVETALRRWLRAYGSLPHPNMLAGLLAAAMFAAVWLYQKTEYGFKKLFLPIIFSVLSLGLFAAFSKSVICSFSAVLIFWWAAYLIFRQEKALKIDLLKFTLIFLAVAAVFSVVFWEPVRTRIYGAERLEIKSTTERLGYFDQSWQLIKKHPFLGVGLGNYTLAVHGEIDPDLQAWDYQPVHNIYLLIFAETGVIGFSFFLFFLFFTLYPIFKTLRRKEITQNLVFWLALLLLLAVGLFDHYFWTLYFGVILFWFNFSLAEKSLDISLDRP